MDNIKESYKTTNIYSTKSFTEDQRLLFHEKVVAKSHDFIKISLNRIPPRLLKNEIENFNLKTFTVLAGVLND